MTFLTRQAQFDLQGQTIFLIHYVRDFYESGAFTAGITLPESLQQAVSKRKAEFIAGRIAAKYALQSLSCSETQVGIGPHRSPIWPEGIVGSISHTDNIAICAVARGSELSSIGVDVENRIDESLCESIAGMVCHSQEQDLRHLTGWEESLFVSVLFSAKESLFKALYPFVGRYLDFHDAQLVRFDCENACFSFMLSSALRQETGISSCDGHYLLEENTVITLVRIKCRPSG